MVFLSSKAVIQRLTENERWRATGVLQNGSNQLAVRRQFNMSQPVISGLWNCHQHVGNVTDLPCSGRPHSTTPHQDHLLVTNALKDRTQSATQLQRQLLHAGGVRVTTRTVRNHLHVAQLHAWCLNIVPPLNANHCQARRVRCRLCQRWNVAQ